jgi:hypothetical protein
MAIAHFHLALGAWRELPSAKSISSMRKFDDPTPVLLPVVRERKKSGGVHD